ncbi:Detected protein of confused Function [Hibiscus syriacus]|uniref:Detected protein of confused Function n=1 Tax=Hibiscus syriacus TaxID=106335 RepID=A0A6A2Y0T8_HIBSY|nr:Detected protein of confused Function [Hibiscus syriacus]KAE8665155.1 Detected protein of confused Function [Hibiscus syriacus]
MSGDDDSTESGLDSNGGEGEEKRVMANIRCSNGTKFTVRTKLNSTVGSFKVWLAQNCNIPTGFKGVTHGVGSNEGPDMGPSLFPGLGNGGSFGLSGSDLPEFVQVQQQLTQNPNMMREIMNTLTIQSLVNNPELMRALITNNPQMCEIIDQNPELGHILNDPSILRQTLELPARNPEPIREMMRNTDRALSNIESSPEGFNMLIASEKIPTKSDFLTTNGGFDEGSVTFYRSRRAIRNDEASAMVSWQHRSGALGGGDGEFIIKLWRQLE